MSKYYGKTNVIVKSNGGVELNISYGLTPPQDTSKVWVKCDTPSKVKIEANRELVVSSSENAKIINITEIQRTSSYGFTSCMNGIKFDDIRYFILYSDSYLFNDNTNQKITRVDENNNISYLENTTSARPTAVAKLPNGNAVCMQKVQSSQTRYYTIFNKNGLVEQFTKNWWFSGDSTVYFIDIKNNKYYELRQYQSNNYPLCYDIINKESGNTGEINVYNSSIGKVLNTNLKNNGVVYNDCAYFFGSVNNETIDLWKLDLSTYNIEVVLSIPFSLYVNANYLKLMSNYLYGNKMIVANINTTNGAADNYNADYIMIIDLDNYTYETINIGYNYKNAFIFVDENTGDIELWGGDPYNSNISLSVSNKKTIIRNIYELEENTLDLFYDVTSNKNINLINNETLMMNAPINHAWLGDENNIAQPVNMYYYDENTNTWKGINCEDYIEE